MNREVAVLTTLIVYQITLVVIGFAMRRRMHSGSDFFLGGRGLGPYVAALSASASSSSAWTLLAVSGSAFRYGLAAVWLIPACVGGFLINWWIVAPRLRALAHQNGALTLTEIFAAPHPAVWRRRISWVCSTIVVFSLAVYVGSQFHGAGKTFEETFGLDGGKSIVLGAAIVLLYTFWGGFWAVSVTDSLQGLLMVATAVLLPCAAFVEVGGWAQLLDGLARIEASNFRSPTREFGGVLGLAFVLGTFGIGLGYPGQPHVVNRFMALKPGRGALRTGRIVALVWALLVYVGMVLLGLCARVLFAELPDPERVFIHATNVLFHPVVAGIMIAAILSAIMSTADSQLLVAASSLTHDLGWGTSGARALLRRSRWVVLGIGAVAVALALVMLRQAQIFNSVLFAWSALGAAFGPLLLVTLYKGVVPPARSLMVIVVGFSSSVLLSWTTTSPGKVLENVVPFLLALILALWPRRRRDSSPVSRP